MRVTCQVLFLLLTGCATTADVERVRGALELTAQASIQRFDKLQDKVSSLDCQTEGLRVGAMRAEGALAKAANLLQEMRRVGGEIASRLSAANDPKPASSSADAMQLEVARLRAEIADVRAAVAENGRQVITAQVVTDEIRTGFDRLVRAIQSSLANAPRTLALASQAIGPASPVPVSPGSVTPSPAPTAEPAWLRYALGLIAIVCGVIVIGIAAKVIGGTSTMSGTSEAGKLAQDLEGKKLHFAAATFTGILLLLLMAALFQFVEPTGPGLEIFDKAITAMSPIAGAIVGYFFAARERRSRPIQKELPRT